MTTSYYRGHKIFCLKNIWYFSDNEKKVSEYPNRKCGSCKKENHKDGHDPCIVNLPGVMNVCCGHVNTKEPTIQFFDRFVITGHDAKIIIDVLKKYKSQLTEKKREKICKYIGKVLKNVKKRNFF